MYRDNLQPLEYELSIGMDDITLDISTRILIWSLLIVIVWVGQG